MEPYSAQVMELLSLGKTSEGAYRIKVAVTHEDRQASYIIDIDEFTYLGLEALRPVDGGRARLSPYPKWDPYHNTYYSAVVRMSGISRETLYFACSEEFIQSIKRLQQNELPPVPIGEEALGNGGEESARRRSPSRRRFAARASRLAGLLLALVVIGLLALSIPTEGQEDPVRLPGGQIGVANAGAKTEASTASAAPVSASQPQKNDAHEDEAPIAAVTADHPAQTQASVKPAAQQAEAGYQVIEVEDDKKFFGLPKEYVALTFDDGPSSLTEKIVDILVENKIAATFLFVGKNVEKHPDAVAYASKHGMAVGNHSWDHSVLTKFTPKAQNATLSKTNAAIEALTGEPVTLFRPPYGAVNDELISSAEKLNMKTLLWNRDPEDWNAKKPEDILRYFHEVEAAGGVYVLHEDKFTAEALPEIIQYLKDKDLKFAIFK